MSELYWAEKPSEEFTRELWTHIEGARRSAEASSISALQRLAYEYFYDAAISGEKNSAFAQRGGERGELVNLRVNTARSLQTALLQIVTAPSISWSTSALNSDPESTTASVVGAQILEAQWKTRGVSQLAIDGVEAGFTYGEGFISTLWDTSLGDQIAIQNGRPVMSGDVAYKIVAPWHVLRDPNKRSYDECTWVAIKQFINKWDLAALYPEKREKILRASTSDLDDRLWAPNALGVSEIVDTDDLPVYLFLHDRTSALPRGRQTLLLSNDVALEDGPLRYKRRPLHRFAAGNLRGTPYGYSSWWLTLGPQEIQDSIQSSLSTNVTTFGSPVISVEAGNDMPVDQISGGPTVLYRTPGSQPPVPMNFSASPPEAFKFLQTLQQAQRQLIGLNDISIGMPETAQMNAQAFSLLYATALLNNRGHQKAYVEFVRNIGQSVIEIYKANCPEPRMVAIVGENQRNLLQPSIKFSGKDLEPIDSVVAEIGNPLAQSAAGRLQLAQLFGQMGFVTTPDALVTILDTGKLDPQLQASRNEYILVSYENKELRAGKPVTVSVYDNHGLHAQEHAGELKKPEVRQDPQAVAVIQEHIQAHHDALYNTDPTLLSLVGITPPQPPPPPQAPTDQTEQGAQAVLTPPNDTGPTLDIAPTGVSGAPDPAQALGNLPGSSPKK